MAKFEEKEVPSEILHRYDSDGKYQGTHLIKRVVTLKDGEEIASQDLPALSIHQVKKSKDKKALSEVLDKVTQDALERTEEVLEEMGRVKELNLQLRRENQELQDRMDKVSMEATRKLGLELNAQQ